MTEHTFDTLAEFHMRHPDGATYALIAHLVSVMENHDDSNIEQTFRNVTNILGEAEAARILHVICQKSHVDYLGFMQNCQAIPLQHFSSKRITPRLLLHIALLPVPYVADKLQLDQYWATQLLDQLHNTFTIDSPLLWLQRLLSITIQERLRYGQEKNDLMMGRAIIGTPKDTAEYRRTKQSNRSKPGMKPPGSPAS